MLTMVVINNDIIGYLTDDKDIVVIHSGKTGAHIKGLYTVKTDDTVRYASRREKQEHGLYSNMVNLFETPYQ